ncbi:hypothetical protein O6H91_08G087700 [Diphasiastrum complanatum]|uniref:Uncharacterized protein n=2 Tax=Diphasiastrum complanatum TaxID=34168 RepID=A0ACC2CZR5_DIPCM|nr:hypothetical protein O6H91_08G087700 [Diphasiastrum complanatum]KAJ7547476.1 hypothetical protein O6H91_08G087700 [Diphasiastrum complanatum]
MRKCRSRHVLCVAFCLFLIVLFEHGEGVNDEGLTLLEFVKGVDDPVGVFAGWNVADPSPCNWTGVSCDANGQVMKLALPNSKLSGHISAGLSGLQHLKILSLSQNSFIGSIPSDILSITSLWKLNLSRNEFSGIIPKGSLPSLRMLDLSKNAVSGSIPSELFQSCGKLRYVSLANNQLVGSIPSSIGTCPKLVGFDFSANKLQGAIPRDIGNLPSLLYLSLERNYLSGQLPRELGSCSSLQYLDLSGNLFFGEVPIELKGMSNLSILAMQENFFLGGIPAEVLYLPLLQYGNFSFNLFSGKMPAPFSSSCNSLQVLDISENNITGALPPTLSQCSMLKFVNISHNKLSSSLPANLGLLAALHTLDLSNNQLSGNLPAEIGDLNQLAVLRLGANAINGRIPPEIGKLELLQILDMESMKLEGSIPSALKNCQFLLEVNLSNNNLSGTIPEQMNNMTYLRSLQLDHNNISGSIPSQLGELYHLENLDLSFNGLTGEIPSSLGALKQLNHFNVSYNMLTGQIPRSGILQIFNSSSFIGNPGLCGLPLALQCGPFSAPPTVNQKRTRVLSVSAIVAITAAVIIAAGVVVVTLMSIRALKGQKTELFVYESAPPSPEAEIIIGKLVLFSKSIPSKYEDWEAGTKALLDKECVIGAGPLGTVFKATFDGGLSIAVKKLETLGRIKTQDDFEQEVGLLGNLKHKHIVTLQGYYWSSNMQLLLSDYVPNGSLFDHLHGRQPTLGWGRRFKIALGTARGLAYLHHDCKPRVLHFDIKSTNILLEEDFEPRISDFGLGKLLPMLDTYMSGRKFHNDLGYVAPELALQSSRLTEKCDVYSYGVVLLEMVTGRRPVENLDSDVIVLCEFVRSSFEEGRGSSCIDPALRSCPESEIMQVLKLGLVCTSQVPSRRPSMAEVVQVLELIKPTIDFREASS